MGIFKNVTKILSTKNTLSAVFWFSLLGFLKPAIGIFLLPLYLIKLTPDDYGVLTMVGAVTAIVAIVSNLRLDTAVRTFYFDHNENEELLWNYMSKIFSTVLGLGIVVFLLFEFVGTPLFELLFDSDLILFKPYGQVALAAILLGACNTIYFIYLKNKVRLKSFFAYSISSILLTIILQVYFILFLDMRIMGVLLGSLIPVIVIFVMVLINNPKLLTFKIDWPSIKPSILFGLPLVPFSFLFVLEKHLDKFILERYVSLEEVGIYGILVSIVGLSAVLLTALGNGIRPFLYQSLKDNDDNTIANFDMFISIYVAVCLVSLSGIIMVGSNIDMLTTNLKYLQVRTYFTWACIAAIPIFLIRFLNLVLVYYKKSGALTMSTMVKTAVMVVLMLLLIPKFGIYGAIASIGISQILNFYLFNRVVRIQTTAPAIYYGKAASRIVSFIVIVVVSFVTISPYNIGLYGLVQFLIVLVFTFSLDRNLLSKLAQIKL